jgi:hypothetical protein
LDKAALYAAHIALGYAKVNVFGDMFTVDCYGSHTDYCHSAQKWGYPDAWRLPEDLHYSPLGTIGDLLRGYYLSFIPGDSFVHHFQQALDFES